MKRSWADLAAVLMPQAHTTMAQMTAHTKADSSGTTWRGSTDYNNNNKSTWVNLWLE